MVNNPVAFGIFTTPLWSSKTFSSLLTDTPYPLSSHSSLPSPQPLPGNLPSVFCQWIYLSYLFSNKWNPTICDLLCLAPSNYHDVLEIPGDILTPSHFCSGQRISLPTSSSGSSKRTPPGGFRAGNTRGAEHCPGQLEIPKGLPERTRNNLKGDRGTWRGRWGVHRTRWRKSQGDSGHGARQSQTSIHTHTQLLIHRVWQW